jgi:hypothetical protein
MAKNKQGDSGEGDAIDGVESKEQTVQQARGSHSEKHSGKQYSQHGPCAFAQDESEDVAFLGADSHADADFAGAEGDDIADCSVDAHRGEQKPQ